MLSWEGYPAYFRHLLFSFVIITFCFLSAGVQAASSIQQKLITASDTKASGEYTFEYCREVQKQPFDLKSGKKKILIIGDSQACDFLNGVRENGYWQDYQIRVRFIPYRCQMVFGSAVEQLVDPKDRAFCANENRADSLAQAREQVEQADVIIMAARWKPVTARMLPKTFNSMELKPNQKVIVIGSKFFGKISVRQYMRMPESKLEQLRNDVGDEAQSINKILAGVLGQRATFVNQHDLVCGKSDSCPLFTSDLNLISYDGRHLTKAGARYVGKILFQQSPLGKL